MMLRTAWHFAYYTSAVVKKKSAVIYLLSKKRVQATCLYKLPFFSQKTALTRENTVFARRTFKGLLLCKTFALGKCAHEHYDDDVVHVVAVYRNFFRSRVSGSSGTCSAGFIFVQHLRGF